MRLTHPHIASLIFNRPLMIHPGKLKAIIHALGPKIGADIYDDDDDEAMSAPAGNGGISNVSPDGIATICVYGSLAKRTMGLDALSGLESYENIASRITAAATDPNCKAILLDIDSYGGECAGAFDLSDLIYQARKTVPVYGIANSHAYSAGYAILSACEKVFVTQDGGVGSIGVRCEHADQSEFDSKVGVKYTSITFGAHKNDFSEHQSLSKEATGELQASVDYFGNMFVALVARNRSMSPKAVLDTQAALFEGQGAITSGLADVIGTRDMAYADLRSRISTRQMAPLPAPDSAAASASAAANSTKEDTSVSQPTAATPPPDLETAKRDAATAATKAAETKFDAYVAQVNSLCAIAGRKDLASQFIQEKLTTEQVSEKLLKLRADADNEELQTEYVPQGTSKEAIGNPNRLINAVKRRLQRRGGVKN